MAMEISTITDSISALTVDGLKIYDLNEIPEAIDPRQPSIFPFPAGFVTNFQQVRDSFGGGTYAKMHVLYDLTYRLCYAPIGAERGLFRNYADMVAAAYRFIDAVLAIDVMIGLEDITMAAVANFGPVADIAGNGFHGCDIVLHVEEFVN